jgi:hypothetical protein
LFTKRIVEHARMTTKIQSALPIVMLLALTVQVTTALIRNAGTSPVLDSTFFGNS